MKNKSNYIFKARSSILINYKSIILLVFLLTFNINANEPFFTFLIISFLAYKIGSPFLSGLYFYEDKIVFKNGFFNLKKTEYELTGISSVEVKSKKLFNLIFNFGDLKFVRKSDSYYFYFISNPNIVKENFEKYYSLVK